MKKNINFKSIIASALILTLGAASFTSCTASADDVNPAQNTAPLKSAAAITANYDDTEFAVSYDANGLITKFEARSDDSAKILADYTASFAGKDLKTVLEAFIKTLGDNGWYVEEIESSGKQLVIEIESEKKLTADKKPADVSASVIEKVKNTDWQKAAEIDGMTDYGVTDYGVNSDGVTDYGVTDYGNTDYGVNSDGVTDYGNTDYGNTDYGVNSDGVTDYGVTDYGNTDYGVNSDGVTDYGNTDYGVNSDGMTDYGVTDYGNTDYGVNSDGVTDYGKTDYGTSNYGKTDYGTSDYGKTDYGTTDYGNTDYDD